METETKMKKLFVALGILFSLASPSAAEIDDNISMYIPGEFGFTDEACARCMLGIDDCDRKAVSKAIKQIKPKLTPGHKKFEEHAFAEWLLCLRRKNELVRDPAIREEVRRRAAAVQKQQQKKLPSI